MNQLLRSIAAAHDERPSETRARFESRYLGRREPDLPFGQGGDYNSPTSARAQPWTSADLAEQLFSMMYDELEFPGQASETRMQCWQEAYADAQDPEYISRSEDEKQAVKRLVRLQLVRFRRDWGFRAMLDSFRQTHQDEAEAMYANLSRDPPILHGFSDVRRPIEGEIDIAALIADVLTGVAARLDPLAPSDRPLEYLWPTWQDAEINVAEEREDGTRQRKSGPDLHQGYKRGGIQP